MQTLHIYAPQKSARLEYICALIFEEMLGLSIQFSDDSEECPSSEPCIDLSTQKSTSNRPFLKIDPFILQTNYRPLIPIKSTHEGLPTLFEHNDTDSILPFCLLSTCFFLVTRYEEYESQGYDDHHRYAPFNSIAYKENFLSIPLIDLWVEQLKKHMIHLFPGIHFKKVRFD